MSISAIRNVCNLNATPQVINNSYARNWGWNLGLTNKQSAELYCSWCSGWHSNSWKFWVKQIQNWG